MLFRAELPVLTLPERFLAVVIQYSPVCFQLVTVGARTWRKTFRMVRGRPLFGPYGPHVCLVPNWSTFAAWPPSGKVREFNFGQGKIREIVVCLFYATTVAIVTK